MKVQQQLVVYIIVYSNIRLIPSRLLRSIFLLILQSELGSPAAAVRGR
jgi:hypothetical protein